MFLLAFFVDFFQGVWHFPNGWQISCTKINYVSMGVHMCKKFLLTWVSIDQIIDWILKIKVSCSTKILRSTTVFSIDNKKCILSSKSAYYNNFWRILGCWRLKEIVHPKIKILSSFTPPQVVPNLYECLCSAKHKARYSEECGKQSGSGAPLTSIIFSFLL